MSPNQWCSLVALDYNHWVLWFYYFSVELSDKDNSLPNLFFFIQYFFFVYIIKIIIFSWCENNLIFIFYWRHKYTRRYFSSLHLTVLIIISSLRLYISNSNVSSLWFIIPILTIATFCSYKGNTFSIFSYSSIWTSKCFFIKYASHSKRIRQCLPSAYRGLRWLEKYLWLISMKTAYQVSYTNFPLSYIFYTTVDIIIEYLIEIWKHIDCFALIW